MSIRIKIIAIFLVVTLIPFIAIGTLIFADFQSSLEKSILNNLDALATVQKNRVIGLMSDYQDELTLFISNYNTLPDKTTQTSLAAFLNQAKNDFPDFKDIHLLNMTGYVIASTNLNEIGKNHAQDDFFIQGKVKYSLNNFIKDQQKKVRIILAGPVILGGKTIGVAVIESGTDELFGLFHDYTGLGKTGDWGLAKRNSSGDALIIVPRRIDHNPDSSLTSTLSRNSINTPITQALMKNEKVFTDIVDYKGVSVLAVTRYIPQEDWGIGVSISKSEAFAPVNSLADHLIFFGALLSLFVIVLGSFLSDLITAPILSLSQTAEKLKDGDFSVQAKVASKDEIGKLAQAFNSMAMKLKMYYLDLEEKVKEKTNQLNERLAESERLNKVMVDRELKMIDLKKEISILKEKITLKNG